MTATATKPKTKASPWGNPRSTAFRKTYIRQITLDGSTAEVHAEILPAAVEVLRMAQEQDLLPEGPVPSYDPSAEEGPAAFGMRLGITGLFGADAWGFVEVEGGIAFAGDFDEAQRLSALAQEMAAERNAHRDIIPERDEAWAYTKPGQRDLSKGVKGDDVLFFQTLMQTVDQGGVFDSSTEAAVCWLQERNGLTPTGVLGEDTWRVLYPRRTSFGLSRGDSGLIVRVLQSLLVAYGWAPDLEVTGRFGVETDKAIRRLQEQEGFRVNGTVRGAEWVVLLGPMNLWPVTV